MVIVLPLNSAIRQLRSWSPLRTWYSVAISVPLFVAAVILSGTTGLTANVFVQLMVWLPVTFTKSDGFIVLPPLRGWACRGAESLLPLVTAVGCCRRRSRPTVKEVASLRDAGQLPTEQLPTEQLPTGYSFALSVTSCCCRSLKNNRLQQAFNMTSLGVA